MVCNRCKNKCDYKEDILTTPCEVCVYSANKVTSRVCDKCINDKCQFKHFSKTK